MSPGDEKKGWEREERREWGGREGGKQRQTRKILRLLGIHYMQVSAPNTERAGQNRSGMFPRV